MSRRCATRARSMDAEGACAGDTASADTATVNGSDDEGETVAVTVAVPPSVTSSGVSTRVSAGTPSSSVMVTVCGEPESLAVQRSADDRGFVRIGHVVVHGSKGGGDAGGRRAAARIRMSPCPSVRCGSVGLICGIGGTSARKCHDDPASASALTQCALASVRFAGMVDGPSPLIALVGVDCNRAGGQQRRCSTQDGSAQQCHSQNVLHGRSSTPWICNRIPGIVGLCRDPGGKLPWNPKRGKGVRIQGVSVRATRNPRP